MSAAEIISNYASLRALTGRMREAAERGDWEPMIEIGQERDSLLEATKPLDAGIDLDDTDRQRKNALIGEILADEGRIRALVEDWMAQFQLDMRSSAQEMRLLKGYGA